MAIFRRNMNEDKTVHTKEVRELPVIVRDAGRGWGISGTILAVLAILLVLWAVGIFDVDFFGTDSGEGIRGGAEVEITPPGDGDLNNLNR